ncbi:MAG: [FeFe] hydrogenase H-cluster radical SAM maturase HydG [Candidatus Omnitrophica bacterium]|nr:[FeFe] hydrogenase H-cluster radical SAM maturase HydG [Candidatus Omnitrophota bacterium]MBU1996035.1 [FeFe] hydrogenase H-cluster radical SAM maturase HydG [Candidatus Omnitrophota bacterium]MBU4333036.1 [FeFe] hydrogenase H-cluster radical SAM maturase HydG [Candidatus Omnitrophota bacterium]
MLEKTVTINDWKSARVNRDQIDKYKIEGKEFIDENEINKALELGKRSDAEYIRGLLQKSLRVENLTLEETAALIAVEDPHLLSEMKDAALKVKKKVYDNRIVTFAPLYLGNYCVNNCLYCGFKDQNVEAQRKVLDKEEIIKEVEVLAGKIGHKRLIVVYGEHPKNDVDYIVESIRTIYDVKVKTRKGYGNIRRVNVNAPPFSIEDLKKMNSVGIGTYQVFQETYHKETYNKVHPINTIKGDYDWRLYSMHRAFEAGIDDVGIGVLFGLYDWRFDLMALVKHSLELEARFGIGPHTVSFPRLEPALNANMEQYEKYRVSDEDFKKIILVLRLAIPHTGMIISARESAKIRRESIDLGVTQMDASTKIGVGSYQKEDKEQDKEKQQFILGDTRSLDELICEFVEKGYITSFCTAGYRCGRTGKCIMDLLRKGEEGKFCKLNAVITFREWLDDFSTEETRVKVEPIIEREIEEVKQKYPKIFDTFKDYYERTKNGERDLYI